jgi:hypothetical protein
MQPLDQCQCIKIKRPDVIKSSLTISRLYRLNSGLHIDAFP